MADQIVRVARMNQTDWQSMSDKAYATATSYTWDDAAARFEAALRQGKGVGKEAGCEVKEDGVTEAWTDGE